MLTRRELFSSAFSLPLGLAVSQAQVGDEAELDGNLQRRYKLTRDRILSGTNPAYTPELILEDVRGEGPRRFTEFSGDVSGRWISALSTASAVYGDSFPQLRPVVSAVLALQHPEGYFGKSFDAEDPKDQEMALLWGNGRLLVGLLEFYALTKDVATLNAAQKLGEFLVRLGPNFSTAKMADRFDASHFAASYICWTQCSEGLAALYHVTRDRRFQEAVQAIAKHTTRRSSDHVHGYLSTLRGILALAEETNDAQLLAFVEKNWQEIATSKDLLVTGAVPEAWSPNAKRTEGCGECDWLRLSLGLYRVTGQGAYLAEAHRTLFNDFAMNQFKNGDFGHVALDANGVPRRPEVHAWWCCTLHGMRAFPAVTEAAFVMREKKIFLALPVSAVYLQPGLRLRAKSRLEENGTVDIQVFRANGHSLHIEQPAWAGPVAITVNGVRMSGPSVASLHAGDRVTVSYPMQIEKIQKTYGVAYAYGPWILGASEVLNNGIPNELTRANRIESRSMRADPDRKERTAFEVPVARVSGDFYGEEYPDQPQVVHLQAVAEQTGLPSTTWQICWQAPLHAVSSSVAQKLRVRPAEGGFGAPCCALLGWVVGRRQRVAGRTYAGAAVL